MIPEHIRKYMLFCMGKSTLHLLLLQGLVAPSKSWLLCAFARVYLSFLE